MACIGECYCVLPSTNFLVLYSHDWPYLHEFTVNYAFQMKLENKQSGLDNILDTEHELQKSTTTNINTTHPISQSSSSASINSTLSSTCTAARDLHSWREDTPPEENSLHIFNYNRNINSILSLHHGDVTNLTCDMLVIPLKRHESSQNQGEHVYCIG